MTWYSFRFRHLVRFAYNLLLVALAPLAIPYWIVRSVAKGHSWSSLIEALGRVPVPKDTTGCAPFWFHAVSVGEIQSCVPFLLRLRQRLPGVPLCVSVGTPSGRALAESQLEGIADEIFRAPLDLPWCVSRVFSRLSPRLLVVAETEIWPNLFFEAKRRGVSAMIVNGRISDRSASKYRAARPFFRHVLSRADRILAQSPADRDRFVAAGASPSATSVGGNFKYDFDTSKSVLGLPDDLVHALDRLAPRFLVVFGSTREGEEAMIAPALRAICDSESGTLAVVAPRHPARFDAAAKVLEEAGLPVLRRSALGPAPSVGLPATLLLDTLGELAGLYRRADLVFVGGSLNGWGGHNVLEPVLFGKPVVVGPTMQNFRQVTDDLLREGGIFQVRDASEMGRELPRLAGDRERRETIGRSGRDWAESQRGASERAADAAAASYRAAMPFQPPSVSARIALGLPATAWEAAARLRRAWYAKGLLRGKRLATPCVSIGNLTVGGTGKTPAVAWLVERLAERGRASAVLTRGYRRKSRTPLLLQPADAAADSHTLGDEAAMLARRFARTAPSTVLGIGADRHAAGGLVEERGGADVFVLDDGFQHARLERDLDIVLIDSSQPFGNGRTLPLGRLREPVSTLGRADVVLITRCEPQFDYSALEDEVRHWSPKARIMRSWAVAVGVVSLTDGDRVPLESLHGKKLAAFCGIGNPHSFFRQARALGCDLVLERSFPDHHRYARRDLEELAAAATAAGATQFLTTTKDAVNLEHATPFPAQVLALEIELEIDGGEELVDQVLRLL